MTAGFLRRKADDYCALCGEHAAARDTRRAVLVVVELTGASLPRCSGTSGWRPRGASAVECRDVVVAHDACDRVMVVLGLLAAHDRDEDEAPPSLLLRSGAEGQEGRKALAPVLHPSSPNA